MIEVFDFRKVSFVVNGKHITGFMDGTGIKCEKNEDNKVPHVGADGSVTYSNSADETGTITITLKQTSPWLKYLVSLSKAKSTSSLYPVHVVDNNNNKFSVGGSKGTILKTPSIEWGSEVAGVDVQFHIANYDVVGR